MGDERTIVQKLFSRRREVDGFPYLRGNQEIDYPARRNTGKAYLSAILCKACWVALKGDVIAINTLKPPGRVQVESRSQTGGPRWSLAVLMVFIPGAVLAQGYTHPSAT